jgi:hypothetical protein
LAGTSFQFRDLLQTKDIFTCPGAMFSEHCVGSKASMFILNPIPPILTIPEFSMINKATDMNPLQQNYVFYSARVTNPIPSVFSREFTFEPSYASKV